MLIILFLTKLSIGQVYKMIYNSMIEGGHNMSQMQHLFEYEVIIDASIFQNNKHQKKKDGKGRSCESCSATI